VQRLALPGIRYVSRHEERPFTCCEATVEVVIRGASHIALDYRLSVLLVRGVCGDMTTKFDQVGDADRVTRRGAQIPEAEVTLLHPGTGHLALDSPEKRVPRVTPPARCQMFAVSTFRR